MDYYLTHWQISTQPAQQLLSLILIATLKAAMFPHHLIKVIEAYPCMHEDFPEPS